MAAEIADRFGIEPELVQGDKGIFDVRVDGDLVFSKHAIGRFPQHGEIVDILAARPGARPGS